MKVFYIACSLLFICGLVFLFYLIPSPSETALIRFKGQEYASSEQYYFKHPPKKGFLSVDELHALVVLDIKEGKVNDAVHLMEEYIHAHPKDLSGYQVLAQLYEESQQFQKYFTTLEQELQMGYGPRELYDQLAFWYELQNDQKKYCAILKRMVDLNIADENQYYALAECYGLEKKYDDAQKILEQKREKLPSKLEIRDFFFEMWAARNSVQNSQEKQQRVINALITFLQKRKNSELAYEAIVNSQAGFPDFAPYLISRVRNLLEKYPGYMKEALNVLWGYPECREEVFQELLSAYHEHTLSPDLQDLFFQALSEREDATLLKEMIPQSNPENFSSENVYTYVYNFMEQKNAVLITELQQAYPPSYLASHPLIATFLAIALHEKDATQRIEALIKSGDLTNLDTFFVFSLAANAGYNDLALQLGALLFPYYGFSTTEIFDIAQIYVKLGKSDEIFDQLKKRFPEGPDLNQDSIASPAFALLYAEKGEAALTEAWLARQKEVEQSVLSGIYSVAAQKQEYRLMYAAALRLEKEFPSPISDAYVADALVHLGEMKKGLAMLDRLSTQFPHSPEIEGLYYTALLFAINKDRTFEGRLANFLEIKSTQEKLSPDKLRDYASVYLDVLHNDEKTEKLLRKLVETGEAQESDIDELVSFIGPHASCQKIDWMVQQAQKAKGSIWSFWLEKLLYAGGYCAVIELFEQKIMQAPPQEIDLKAAFAYLDALAFLKKKCELRKGIDLVLTKTAEVKDLEKLVLYTEEADYQNARKQIWKKITAKKPCDPLSWQNLASALFDQNEYCAAAGALLRFFELEKTACSPNSNLYQSLFQFAEILYIKQSYREANLFYSLALCQIYAAKKKTIAMRETESLICFRLGAKSEALGVAYRLYEETSRDPGFAAGYVNMIMDAGAFDIARGFILEGVSN